MPGFSPAGHTGPAPPPAPPPSSFQLHFIRFISITVSQTQTRTLTWWGEGPREGACCGPRLAPCSRMAHFSPPSCCFFSFRALVLTSYHSFLRLPIYVFSSPFFQSSYFTTSNLNFPPCLPTKLLIYETSRKFQMERRHLEYVIPKQATLLY